MAETTITGVALSALPQGVVLFDKADRLRLINPAAARMLAADPEACFGMTRDAFVERFQLPHKLGPERVWAGSHSARFLVQALQLAPQARAAGLSAGLLLIETPPEFALLERLEQSLNYDMRTPLNVIRNGAELLQRGLLWQLPMSAEGKAMGELMLSCGTRVLVVVEQNRRLIRFSDPSWSPCSCEQDIANVLVSMFVQARNASRGPREGWDLELPKGTLTAFTDRELLTGAVTELLDRANDATHKGGTVILRAREEPGSVVISVEDTGPGLSLAALARLQRVVSPAGLTPSETQELDRSELMLWLAVCKGGLQIVFEGTPGVGTTARVTVPRHAAASPRESA